MRIILASQSPRRRQLLGQLGVTDFEILVPEADESYDPALSPQEIVASICRKKAEAARELAKDPDALLIAADTMVFREGLRLGKPRDEADARAMLRSLSGKTHEVCTGLTLCRGKRMETRVETTGVTFRDLTDREIDWYVQSGEPMDKAGAYGIQGGAALFVTGISGDYFNVMGLPLCLLGQMLGDFGVDLYGGKLWKRLLTKYGVMVLALAVTIAVLLSVMAFFSSTSAAFPNLAGIIASPFRSAGAAITNTVGGWVDYFTEYDALKTENEELRLRIAEMESDLRQAERDREENKRLRELNDLRKQRRDLYFESARVVEADDSNWSSILTINKGTVHDVAVGDCVITEAGYLVGVVTEAGLNWSTVRTVLDSETSIGALVFRSSQNAVAQGDFALMGEGRLKLGYLGTEPDLVAGDLVVTSGLGGYFPPQLVIGYVEEIATGDDGLAQYAVIAPQMELEGLEQVFVVTSFDIVE